MFAVVTIPAAAQAPAGGQGVARTADGKPDLSGIWQVRNTAWGDLEDHPARLGDGNSARTFVPAGLSVVEGGTIPYNAAGLAKKKENMAKQADLDPLGKCYMPGPMRLMYLQLPFQIFQTPKYIAVVSEYSHSWRVIYTDGSTHLEGIEFWMGDSRARWEGDTLVVDVRNLNDKTWFDMAGNHHSADVHITERITRMNANVLQYEATVEDPKVFTRPWKVSMPIYRVQPTERDRILEYECAVLQEEAAGTFVDLPEDPSVQR
jgi:hypothetical protein